MANSGGIYSAKNTFKVTLADCAVFRTWVDASGDDIQVQALNRIYKDAAPPPADGDKYTLAELQALRPFALLWTEPGFQKLQDASAMQCSNDGAIRVGLEQDVPDRICTDFGAIADEFELFLETVINQMLDLSGGPGGGYLTFAEHPVTDLSWSRNNPDNYADEGDAVTAEFVVHYLGL